MSRALAANEILLRQILLEDGQAVDPSASGFAAPIGSMFIEHGTYPTTPTDTWLKSGAGDTDWLKQNLTGVRTFNVKDPAYGAVGDGVTDDLIPINRAIAACQAAGGGIVYFPPGTYIVSKNVIPSGLAEYVSFYMDNAPNMTFLGDGEASKISFVGDSAGTFWDGFYFKNGCNNTVFRDLSLNGSGMITANGGGTLIQWTGKITDASPSSHDFTLQGCTLGPATVGGLFIDASDVAATLTGIRCLDNSLDATASVHTGAGTGAVNLSGFFDHALVARNYCLGGTGQVAASIVRLISNGFAIPPSILDWNVSSNHIYRADDGSAVGAILSCGGLVAHNTVGGQRLSISFPSGTTMLMAKAVVGNCVVQDGTSGNTSAPIINANNHSANGQSTITRGNIACRTVYTGAPTSVVLVTNASFSGTLINISDNVAETGSTTTVTVVSISSPLNSSVIADGNIAIIHASPAGLSNGVAAQSASSDGPVVAAYSGNMTLAVDGADPLYSISSTGNAGFNTRLCSATCNLSGGFRRMVNYGAGTRSQWLNAGCNNHSATTATLEVNPPAANAGFTALANAGGSPQVMVSGATMISNVMASKGSLGVNTAGAQGTTLFYKQTDDATPAGGTAGWFGVCGYELTFGTVAGSTTATALFYAGGMGIASPSATEIQYPMPRPGTLRNLRFRCVAGTGGGTCTFVVRKNGVNTAITIAPLNTATSASDTTNSAAVVRGDLISFQVTKTGTITTAQTLSRAVLELAS